MRSVAGLWVGVGLLVGGGAARAQQGTPDGTQQGSQQGSPDGTKPNGAIPGQKSCSVVDENGKTVVWPNCQPPAEDKAPPAASGAAGGDAAKKFPFPGEAGSATPAATSGAAAKPGDNADQPAAKRFPFPGEQPAAATPAGGDTKAAPASGGFQDAGSSGSSSSSGSPDSSSSSSSSANAGEGGTVGPLADDDDAAKAAAARKAARHKLPPVARQSPDEREAEDLKVASFYMDDKNYRGAYSRATDAVAIAADDADAHFALAEAARRLGKLDEAMTHYKKCLTLDPVPKVKRESEKALKEMAGG